MRNRLSAHWSKEDSCSCFRIRAIDKRKRIDRRLVLHPVFLPLPLRLSRTLSSSVSCLFISLSLLWSNPVAADIELYFLFLLPDVMILSFFLCLSSLSLSMDFIVLLCWLFVLSPDLPSDVPFIFISLFYCSFSLSLCNHDNDHEGNP